MIYRVKATISKTRKIEWTVTAKDKREATRYMKENFLLYDGEQFVEIKATSTGKSL